MKKIEMLIVFLCSSLGIMAQDYSVTIECPDTVGINENISIKYNITSSEPEFSIKFSGFRAINADVISGPSTSTSSSVSIVNGLRSEKKGYTYTYVVIADSKTKDVIVEPLNFEISKGSAVQKTIVVPRKVIKVIEGYKGDVSDSADIEKSNSTKKDKTSLQDINPDDIIIKWSASAQTINLGDTIHCYCDIYTKIDVTAVESSPHICLDDCYVEEDSLPQEKSFETVEYNGEKYRCVRWSGYRLTPLRTGRFNIGGDTFICKIILRDPNIDPFEAFFNGGSSYHEMPYNEVSESVEFDVKGKMMSQTIVQEHNNSTEKTYLLCDISTSMKSRDFTPDRMTIAKDLVYNLLKESTDYGLITFAGNIESIQKTNAVIDTVSFPQYPKVDGTALGDAMLAAPAMGEDVSDVILITDGTNNAGHFTLRTSIDILAQRNIRISLIYLNSCKDSVDYPLSDSVITMSNSYLEAKKIKEISKLVESTGGLFAKITSEKELNSILPKLHAIVSKPRRQIKAKARYDKEQVRIALQRLVDEVK